MAFWVLLNRTMSAIVFASELSITRQRTRRSASDRLLKSTDPIEPVVCAPFITDMPDSVGRLSLFCIPIVRMVMPLLSPKNQPGEFPPTRESLHLLDGDAHRREIRDSLQKTACRRIWYTRCEASCREPKRRMPSNLSPFPQVRSPRETQPIPSPRYASPARHRDAGFLQF